MIDKLFSMIILGIAGVVKFIIVFMFLGLVLILPFLLKGGWVLWILIGAGIIDSIRKNKDKDNK